MLISGRIIDFFYPPEKTPLRTRPIDYLLFKQLVMKKKTFLLSCIVLLQLTASAKIWRVNNTCVPADFTTAQAANHSVSVVNGDTIHLEASGSSYGSLNITKQLVIIGNGYLLGTLGSNANPDLQANPATSLLLNVTFSAGSNGTVMQGITATGTLAVTSGVSNVTIRRNRLNTVNFSSCSNIQLLQNYIDLSVVSSIQGDGSTNLQINNNVLSFTISLDAACNGDFMNNIMSSVQAFGAHQLSNFRVWNNINVLSSSIALTSCDSRNNISSSTQFGTLNGNQQNVTMSTVFEDHLNSSPSFSEDSRWTLKAGSPAIAAAWNGVTTGGDCGVFGSSATGISYVLSGISNVPSIYKLVAPATVTTNTLNITISTKTNN